MRKFLYTLIAIIVIAIVLVYLFFGKLERAVADKIEQQGERLFGAEVVVSDVDLDILNGKASISEISIANPPGYTQPNAITLSGISAQLDYKSLVIKEILISQPRINAELINNKLNIEELASHAAKASQPGETGDGQAQEPDQADTTKKSEQDKEDENAQIFTIDRVAITNAQVELRSDLLEQPQQFELELIETTNLKGSPHFIGNQLATGLLNDLLGQVIAQSIKTVGKEKLNDLKDKALKKLNQLLL